MAVAETSTRILITIPKDLKAKLEEKAKEANRSVSNYIVNLILEDIERPTKK